MPYSVIELIEEIVMIVVGSLLVLCTTDVFEGALRAGAAVVISYMASFTIAVIYFFLHGGRLCSPKGYLRPLFSSSVSITTMKTSTSLINMLIAIILPLRLTATGIENAHATTLYGTVTGMSMPVLFTPITLIGSLAVVLVPELSENFYKKKRQKLKADVEKSIKISVLISCALIPVFCALGKDFAVVIFDNSLAGEIIAISSPMLLPMSLTVITTSILNSIGEEKKTLLFYFIGAVAMLLCVIFLPKYIGIWSLCAGYALSYIITSVLNLALIERRCKGARYKKSLLSLLSLSLPVTVSGKLILSLIEKIMPLIPALIITLVLILSLTALLYIVFGIVDLDKVKKFLPAKRSRYKSYRNNA